MPHHWSASMRSIRDRPKASSLCLCHVCVVSDTAGMATLGSVVGTQHGPLVQHLACCVWALSLSENPVIKTVYLNKWIGFSNVEGKQSVLTLSGTLWLIALLWETTTIKENSRQRKNWRYQIFKKQDWGSSRGVSGAAALWLMYILDGFCITFYNVPLFVFLSFSLLHFYSASYVATKNLQHECKYLQLANMLLMLGIIQHLTSGRKYHITCGNEEQLVQQTR